MTRLKRNDMSAEFLKKEEIEFFRENGFLILPGFYAQKDIEQIQAGIYGIIGLVIDKYELKIKRESFSTESFDSGFQDLIRVNRKYGAEVYDAVKQIPAFIRLAADERHEKILCALRKSDLAGIAAGGYGIRIDNPFEEQFRATWHQEYPAQLRSPDGLVYWSSLVPISPEMGAVKVCPGSQHQGCIPVHTTDPANPGKNGAYSLILENELELIQKYPQIELSAGPGDLAIMDFMLIHASGYNRGTRSRWSMQIRYFNFNNPTGVSIGWKGSFSAGQDFCEIHPELCIDK